MTEHCGNCKFFEPRNLCPSIEEDYENPLGACLRFPPVYVKCGHLDDFNPSVWLPPIVETKTTWCGEWKPKVKTPKKRGKYVQKTL